MMECRRKIQIIFRLFTSEIRKCFFHFLFPRYTIAKLLCSKQDLFLPLFFHRFYDFDLFYFLSELSVLLFSPARPLNPFFSQQVILKREGNIKQCGRSNFPRVHTFTDLEKIIVFFFQRKNHISIFLYTKARYTTSSFPYNTFSLTDYFFHKDTVNSFMEVRRKKSTSAEIQK